MFARAPSVEDMRCCAINPEMKMLNPELLEIGTQLVLHKTKRPSPIELLLEETSAQEKCEEERSDTEADPISPAPAALPGDRERRTSCVLTGARSFTILGIACGLL